MHLNQYIGDLTSRFEIGDMKASTPYVASETTPASGLDELDLDARREYQALVGSLIFCMTTVRLDIAYTVGLLAQRMATPRVCDLKAAVRCLAYLSETRSLGILFRYKPTSVGMETYVDADWAGDVEKRRSRSGFVNCYNGTPISWYSGLQHLIALSSTEAEYISASHAGCEVKYLQQLQDFLGQTPQLPTRIWEDNNGTMSWVENHVHHRRSKHIEVKYHHIRSLVESKDVKFEKVDSGENLVDAFTKAVPRATFEKSISALMFKL
jgi:hypothetical protein